MVRAMSTIIDTSKLDTSLIDAWPSSLDGMVGRLRSGAVVADLVPERRP